jgi:hypothetical protein
MEYLGRPQPCTETLDLSGRGGYKNALVYDTAILITCIKSLIVEAAGAKDCFVYFGAASFGRNTFGRQTFRRHTIETGLSTN